MTYADGSFANNYDKSSRLGYLLLHADRHDVCNIVSYRYFKSRHVTRSIQGAEVMAFAEAFGCAFPLQRDLENLFSKLLPLTM